MAATDITWTAILGTTDPEDGEVQVELVVRKDIRAGVCGPFFVQTFPVGVALGTVEAAMADHGLTLQATGWTARTTYAGLAMEALLDMA